MFSCILLVCELKDDDQNLSDFLNLSSKGEGE